MLNFQLTFFADVFSAAILLLLLVSIVPSRRYRYGSTKALIVGMAITFASILSDAFNYYCEGRPELDGPHAFSMAFTLLSVNFIETFVGVYINCYVNEHKKPGVKYTYLFSIITSIVEGCCFLLTLGLGISGQIFVLIDGHQAPGSMYIIPFILDATASIFMIGYIFSHTQFISTKDSITILTVVVFTAAGYLIDGMHPGYNFSVMFGLIAIMLNYLLVKDREVLEFRNEEESRFRNRVQSVLALSDNFEIIFLVNLDNGKYKVAQTMAGSRIITGNDFTNKDFANTDFASMEHFIEKNREFILKRVHPDDRHLVLDAIDLSFLEEKFKNESDYTISYRLLRNGAEVWHKMRVKPEHSWPERHKVLIGIFNNDEAYRKEREHELALEKQLARYSLVHSMMKSCSWSAFFDTEKKIYRYEYSDEILSNFSYSSPDKTNILWKTIIHPDDIENTKQALASILADGSGKTTFDIDHRMRTKDGAYHWYHSSGRVLLNEDGSGELLGTHINTDTEHEKLELEEQRERDFQFMQFRTDIFDFIATNDSGPENFFNYFADRILDSIGCDQVMYRRTDGYILQRVKAGIPETPLCVCENCIFPQHVVDNLSTCPEYCINTRSECTDDLPICKECPSKSIFGRTVYNKGETAGFLAVHYINSEHTFTDGEKYAFREISNLLTLGLERIKAREDQKLDYERYRLLHEIVHSGMWLYHLNKDNKIIKSEYSDELLSIIGWDREHMLEGSTNFQEAIHPDDYEQSTAAFNAALQDTTGRTIFDSEYRMRNQQGEYHWFRSAGRVIRYENGNGEFFGTHINIDAEKKREELQTEIERARDNAEAASAAKTAFLFNMSHDIRTPLNAIIGFTDMARTHKNEIDKVDDYLTKVQTSSDFLLTIVNDVLDMSRIEAGKTEIDERVYNVTTEAANVAELNSVAARNKEITFIPSLENCTHPYIIADAVHIKQIVVNILNNAMKYTPAGGTIWYTVREEPAENPDEVTVISTIKDNGIGMDEKFVARIYEPFERAQSTTQSGITGTGLGMSIVKRLTDLLGGKIEIDSKPGKGTTVSVSFNHKIATDEQINQYESFQKQQEASEMKIDEEKLVGKRLLLVEDNDLNREISEQILQERGLIIETAMDGLDAYNRIKEKGSDYYDFVLMDIQMPVMDGYAATREIRKLPGARKLPIAAFSANAFEEDKKRCLEAGMNIHVSKPINIKELTRSLASLL